ncbi:hypothetical protein [Nafulsella turpanensis]|uniref:hypothetical protein n=1 Tax=Nafulsella turpanensis TaxID=1265690 RepID=UPI000347FEE0|nr:hypothetical protein [Nafulsella turpanensis]
MKNFYYGILFIFLLSIGTEGFSQGPSFLWKLEPLNVEERKNKELFKNLSRTGFQLDQKAFAEGELILKFSYLPALGKGLRRRRDKIELSLAEGNSFLVERDEIRSQLFYQFQEKEKGNTNKRNFRRALKRKRRVSGARDAPYTINFGKLENLNPPFHFTFYRKDEAFARLVFDTTAVAVTDELPYIEYSDCFPFDRNSYFKDYFSRIYSGLTPYPYRPREGVKKIRTFNLYFEKNKAEFQQEDLEKVIQFLNDTLYVIKKAEVGAWASVEGSFLNNKELQEERAEILIQALETYYGDSIPYTVSTKENWPLFYEQLQEKGIDSTALSKEEWKALFLSKEEQENWEPLLARQRKAELKLFVVVKLSAEQKHQLAKIKFRKLAYDYLSDFHKKRRPSILKTLLGIRRYLEEEVRKGHLDVQELCELEPPEGVYEYHLIHFYEQAKRFDNEMDLYCDFEESAIKSFHLVKRKYLSDLANIKVYGDLLSIQSYIYQKIIEKKFSVSAACEVYFPENAGFHHLYLNFLNFTNTLKDDPSFNYECEREEEFDWKAIDADSRYYYLLKQLVFGRSQIRWGTTV